MHAPVLVTAPMVLPVTREAAKQHLKREATETFEDSLIDAYLAAAVSHLDGWTGILGRAMCPQTWRQDFDCLSRCIRIPVGPVISVTSITTRNSDGELATIATDNYAIYADAIGSYVRFKDAYSYPTDLYEKGAVRLTWLAGYPVTAPDAPALPVSLAPDAIKHAILLMIGNWHANREAVVLGTIVAELPFAVQALLAPYTTRIM